MVWATGWEDRANDHLPGIIGVPELPYLTFDGRARFGTAHWKLEALEEYARGRPLAWIDDSLDSSCYEWAERRARADPARPDGVEPRARGGPRRRARILGRERLHSVDLSPMEGALPIMFLLVVLKIPVFFALYLVWWSAKSYDEFGEELAGGDEVPASGASAASPGSHAVPAAAGPTAAVQRSSRTARRAHGAASPPRTRGSQRSPRAASAARRRRLSRVQVPGTPPGRGHP